MEKVFSNFRRYLGNGQRLSIFGRELDGKLEVFILKCSPEDQLDKDLATGIYNYYLTEGAITNKKGVKIVVYQHFINTRPKAFHPEIVLVPIKEGNTANYEFVQFCKQFYKKVTKPRSFYQDFLVKEEEMIKVGNPRLIFNKYSIYGHNRS